MCRRWRGGLVGELLTSQVNANTKPYQERIKKSHPQQSAHVFASPFKAKEHFAVFAFKLLDNVWIIKILAIAIHETALHRRFKFKMSHYR
jgi:hypothetical protein